MKWILIFISVFLIYKQSYCCTCIGEATFQEECKRSNFIVIGKVINKRIFIVIDSLMPSIKIQRAEYTVKCIRVYKGYIKDSIIKIITGLGSGDCGYEFCIGNEYIIYCSFESKYYEQGNPVRKFLYTDICRRTRLANDIQEIKLLNRKFKKNKYKRSINK
jgi:hypothetical protein